MLKIQNNAQKLIEILNLCSEIDQKYVGKIDQKILKYAGNFFQNSSKIIEGIFKQT